MPIKELNVELSPNPKKAEIFARRSVLSKTLSGSWVTSFKGQGIEFAGYRSYQYGDDASMIDWFASLRNKSPLVREFEEYRSFSVFILLDVSNSMLFSSNNKLKAEHGAELAYALADSILRAGDAVGLGMFTDEMVKAVYPNIGRGVLDGIGRELINKENYGGGFNFKKAIREAMSFLGNRGVIVIISDFLGLEEGWQSYVRMCAQTNELLAIMLRDPRDRHLPEGVGQFTLGDPYNPKENIFVDIDKIAEEYKELVINEERIIQNTFEKAKGGLVVLETGTDYSNDLVKFFRKRQFIASTV